MAKLRLGIILAIVGAALVIVGAVWMTAIFPSMEKVPTDYGRTTSFEGTYTVAGSPFPVILNREHMSNGTVGGVLLINEKISAINKDTGEVDPRFTRQNVLAVDRKTREFKPGGNIPREGQWSPPSHLEKGEGFFLWNPAANKALNTTYVTKEKFRGMTVFKYTINETHLETAHRVEFDTVDILINLWVEPVSGTTVGQNSRVEYYSGEYSLFTSDIGFTEETIVDLMDIAKDARTKLRWFGVYVPWIVICLGAVLFVVSVAVMLRKGLQKA